MTEEVREAGADNLVGIGDFMKIELRVGKILECERVEKSKKLLRMQVDLGKEVRQIVAGLALFYLPAELVGRRVVVVANLEPAKLMGIESQGMLLAAAAESGDSPPVILFPPDGVPLGARVR